MNNAHFGTRPNRLSRRQFLALSGLAVPGVASRVNSLGRFALAPGGNTPEQVAAQLRTLWSVNYTRYSRRTIYESASLHYVLSKPGVAAMTPEGGVSMIDLRTGTPHWQSGIDSRVGGADEQCVYLPVAPNRIDALDSSSGELKWRFLLETADYDLFSDGQIFSSTNAVYLWLRGVHNPVGGFLAVDKNTGQQLWVSGREIVHAAPEAIVVAERVSGTFGVTFSGFEAESGLVRWNWPSVGYQSDANPIIIGNTIILRHAPQSEGFVLRSVNLSTGEDGWVLVLGVISWMYEYKPNDLSLYVLLQDATGAAYSLLAIDPTLGEVRWTSPADLAVGNRSYHPDSAYWEFVGEWGGVVVFSSESFGLTRAYDKLTFAPVWENGQLVIEDGKVVGLSLDTLIFRSDTALVGIDIHSGEKQWEHTFDIFGSGLKPVLLNDRLFFSGQREYGIQIIDPATGEATSLTLEGMPDAAFVFENQVLVESLVDELFTHAAQAKLIGLGI